nr:hypothetical protein [Tanacetum cinerariifolium]
MAGLEENMQGVNHLTKPHGLGGGGLTAGSGYSFNRFLSNSLFQSVMMDGSDEYAISGGSVWVDSWFMTL